MRYKSVALHMSLNTFHRLEIAQGVVQYAKEHAQWRIFGSFYTSRPILNYKTWTGDGIISICHDREDARGILATGLPIVDTVQGFSDERIVNVTCDNVECGKWAGQHLLSTGLNRFAFCHLTDLEWSDTRGKNYAETVGVPIRDMPVFERQISWWQNHRRSRALEKFLLSLPPRTAILAGNDNAGVKVTAACQSCGRKVPEDLVVMGIDGDDLQCELSYPSLSTVAIDGIRIGYEAARRLDELMRGGAGVSRSPVRIPPKRVVMRASSNTVACDDEAVLKAVHFIRQNFAANISVSDVAREATVCRRALEQRFRRHLGKTVLEEIQANRLRLAQALLKDTDLPVNKIFPRCGFMAHQAFYSIFNRHVGMTPQQYRDKNHHLYTGSR